MSMDNKVKLISSDNELFEVDESVVQERQTLKNLTAGTGLHDAIPVPAVCSEILAKVIEYCKCQVESQKSSDGKPAVSADAIKQWDAKFIEVDFATLAGLVNAAKYLNIRSLLDLACQALADMITGKTALEIREIFEYQNERDRR